MKKIVRLTESDIVRLVKKVIVENKKMLNEAPVPTDSGGAYRGHFVKALEVVQGGKPFLDVIMSDGTRKKYKVTTKLGDVNFDKVWMSGDKLGVRFYSGGGGKTTDITVPGNKTYDLFEKLKNKPGYHEIVNDSITEPNIKFVAV
jgi:hypothetical protein